jgi:hypothetical protein
VYYCELYGLEFFLVSRTLSPARKVPLIYILTPIARRAFGLGLLLFFGTFAVSVSAQCALSCNQNLNISLNQNGQALITASMIAPSAATFCPGPLEVNLFNAFGQPLANPLTCSHIGLTITAQVRHIASGNNCSTTLQLSDAIPPTLTCPDKFVFCVSETDPATVGFPTMSDNCTPVNALSYSFFDVEIPLGCGTTQNGMPVLKRIERQWIVTDAQGNSNECTQKIWLKHISLPDITFPANRDGLVQPSLNCGQDPTDLSLTGEPSVEGVPVGHSPQCEIAVTHTDQIINVCPPAGYTVLRNWTAVDFCSSTITNRIQIIKVQDKTPPMLTTPADMTVGTDGFLCSGTVLLPAATTSDDCSNVTTTATWAYGNGFGPFSSVPKGQHTVTYRATDACGNSSTATMRVTVEDQSPPQAICASSLQVSLASNGQGYVNAAALNVGSSDNCGLVFLSVSRDEVTFEPQILVSCADLGAPMALTLRVRDDVGLENFCQTEITVRDLVKPSLTCPATATLNCQQDFTNLTLTGNANATDNCALQSLDFVDVINLNGCNIGTVQRTWTARDSAGNTRSCTQQITLNALNTAALTFPTNKVVSNCASGAAWSPTATGEPIISGQHCFPLNATYTDQVFTNNLPPPTCFRILRQWTVIDFCIYNPNGGSAGIWQQTQTIDIQDNAAPVLQLQADVTVSAAANCQAQVNLSDALATDCSAVTLSHNSLFATSAGANASGIYPLGQHTVVFTAMDACGHTAQKTLLITVADQSAPMLSCPQGVTIPLGVGGNSTIYPAQFILQSSDQCTDFTNLIFSAQPNTFTCQDVGNQIVVLSATDAAGNTGTCSATVIISDNANICNPVNAFVVEGQIVTETGVPVRNIPVVLTSIGGFVDTVVCDTAGHYRFEDVPSGAAYTVRPAYNANALNGISTFDLVLMSKHILGLDTLESPWTLLAVDANRSGSVTTFDIVQFRKLILGVYSTIPNNASWRFIDAAFVFPDPQNPFSVPVPEQIDLGVLNSHRSGLDFIGIKVGDANNSTDPTQN